jgi:hypothetical protein
MEAADRLSGVLPFMAIHIGLQGVYSLAASSKQLRAACSAIIRQDATSLLLEAVKEASATAAAAAAAKAASAAAGHSVVKEQAHHQAVLKQQVQAVQWLLQLHPSAATAAGAAERLLHTPLMSEALVRVLIHSGVRITFAQLIDAADSMVEGLEVWVPLLAIVQEGQRDMPMAVFTICSPGCWVSCMLCVGWCVIIHVGCFAGHPYHCRQC